MFSFLSGSTLWHLILQSDAVSWAVLIFLLLLSVVCWTLFFYKVILLRIKKRQLHKAFERMETVDNLQEFITVASGYMGTLPGYFLSKNLSFIKMPLETNKEQGLQTMSVAQWEIVQHHMYQLIDEMMFKEEGYLPLFSTTAAISTLLGLFGTIWGLVNAFVGISEKQAADITAVAPGIAQALTTTLAGLMVAIPAIILLNYLQSQARTMEHQLTTFADRVGFVIQRFLVR
jgi:biopolymer transport protein ExbB/TolQ